MTLVVAPSSRIHARFDGVGAQEIKDELVHLLMEHPVSLGVRHPTVGLRRRLTPSDPA